MHLQLMASMFKILFWQPSSRQPNCEDQMVRSKKMTFWIMLLIQKLKIELTKCSKKTL